MCEVWIEGEKNLWGNASRCEKIAWTRITRRPRENAYVMNRNVSWWIHPLRLNLASIPGSSYFVRFLVRLWSSSFHFHLFYVTSRYIETRASLQQSTPFNRRIFFTKTSGTCEKKMGLHRIRIVLVILYVHRNINF